MSSNKRIFNTQNSIKYAVNRHRQLLLLFGYYLLELMHDIRPLRSSHPVKSTISSLPDTNHVKNIFKKSMKSHFACRTCVRHSDMYIHRYLHSSCNSY